MGNDTGNREGSIVLGLVAWIEWLADVHLRHLLPLEAKVLIVLVRHANNATAEAWPSVRTIGDKVGCRSDSRVRRALRGLEAKGLLVTINRGGGRRKSAVRRLTLNPVDNRPGLRMETRSIGDQETGSAIE
ncbi:MAG: Helix-turn-helix domain [Phycisphaerales bacterium]|jgi:hypothetical protein|nr:Helix-turn-helix domain [Phycisphaerales bacterium]